MGAGARNHNGKIFEEMKTTGRESEGANGTAEKRNTAIEFSNSVHHFPV